MIQNSKEEKNTNQNSKTPKTTNQNSKTPKTTNQNSKTPKIINQNLNEKNILSHLINLDKLNKTNQLLITLNSLQNYTFSNSSYQLIFSSMLQTFKYEKNINLQTVYATTKTITPSSTLTLNDIVSLTNPNITQEQFFESFQQTTKSYKLQQQLLSVKNLLSQINPTNFKENQIYNLINDVTKITYSFKNPTLSLSQITQNYLNNIDGKSTKQIQDEIMTSTLKTKNYHKFNELIGLIDKNNLIIFGGKTGFGKTTFALNLLFEFSEYHYETTKLKTGIGKHLNSMFFSYEMEQRELFNRIIAQRTKIDINDIINFAFPDNTDDNYHHQTKKQVDQKVQKDGKNRKTIQYNLQREKLEKTLNDFSKFPFIFEFMPHNRDISYLETKARIAKANDQLDILFVDHLHLMTSANEQNIERITNDITLRLKMLSTELSIPIICLAQYTKEESQKKDASYDTMSFKGGSAISQNANIVFNIQKSNEHLIEDASIIPIKLILSKNRSGKTGVVFFNFDMKTQTFSQNNKEPFQKPLKTN